jgi:hypothetical protein
MSSFQKIAQDNRTEKSAEVNPADHLPADTLASIPPVIDFFRRYQRFQEQAARAKMKK